MRLCPYKRRAQRTRKEPLWCVCVVCCARTRPHQTGHNYHRRTHSEHKKTSTQIYKLNTHLGRARRSWPRKLETRRRVVAKILAIARVRWCVERAWKRVLSMQCAVIRWNYARFVYAHTRHGRLSHATQEQEDRADWNELCLEYFSFYSKITLCTEGFFVIEFSSIFRAVAVSSTSSSLGVIWNEQRIHINNHVHISSTYFHNLWLNVFASMSII